LRREVMSIQYQTVLLILDDDGAELGSIVSDRATSTHAAAKDLLAKYRKLQEQGRLQKRPVDLADDLKWPSHRLM
jgi:hypothetical protein